MWLKFAWELNEYQSSQSKQGIIKNSKTPERRWSMDTIAVIGKRMLITLRLTGRSVFTWNSSAKKQKTASQTIMFEKPTHLMLVRYKPWIPRSSRGMTNLLHHLTTWPTTTCHPAQQPPVIPWLDHGIQKAAANTKTNKIRDIIALSFLQNKVLIAYLMD